MIRLLKLSNRSFREQKKKKCLETLIRVQIGINEGQKLNENMGT